ncbi:hypothetical protein RV11_GL003452 [Enterococcus phoeniculicola]|nr:hypothetical protein RV11_GL003452 [Enterococcus phoeniculicola]
MGAEIIFTPTIYQGLKSLKYNQNSYISGSFPYLFFPKKGK